MEDGKGVSSDHGGGVDEAIRLWGGRRADWLDLSTGINPEPYPYQGLTHGDWTDLPDRGAFLDLEEGARQFWQIPDTADVLAVNGLSAAIAILPYILHGRSFLIREPTYNEYGHAFRGAGWSTGNDVTIVVHPNNPDGVLHPDIGAVTGVRIIDESFCDTMPAQSLMHLAGEKGVLILKSFGKFWGLAGLRLGFVAGYPDLIAKLAAALGPWPVSGPALRIGAAALSDADWAARTRARLQKDADRLDSIVTGWGGTLAGGTPLFRLFEVDDAKAWHDNFARKKILTRIFPYSKTWIRLGLPPASARDRFEAAR
jgi:cobalamin biosynthetic protein CobC